MNPSVTSSLSSATSSPFHLELEGSEDFSHNPGGSSSITRRSGTNATNVTSSTATTAVFSIHQIYFNAFGDNVCFIIPHDWVMLNEEGKGVECNNTAFTTICLLLNVMIGSGILVQAYVFAEAGIVLTIVAYLVITVMIYTGVEMMIRVAEAKQTFDNYANIISTVLGSHWADAIDVCIVLNNAGALLSYILIIGSLLKDIIAAFVSCSTAYCNIGFLTVLPIVAFAIPLCLIRNFGHLAIISYISILVIVSIMLLVIIGGPIRHTSYQEDDTMQTEIHIASFVGLIKNIGDIVFALGYITATFHAYNAMADKNIPKFTQVAWRTTIIGALMCFVTGLVGYLSFRNKTETNILDNFPGILGAVFKLGLVIHLIFYIPGDFVILRAALWKLCKVDVDQQSNSQFISVTLISTFTITFVAIMLQLFSNANNLGAVINVTGGITGSVLYFVAPGYANMVLFAEEANTYRRAVALFVFGIAIVLLVIVGEALT